MKRAFLVLESAVRLDPGRDDVRRRLSIGFAASLHGGMETGFLTAAHAGWWIMAGCGCAVLLLGVISTTQWARATLAKAAGEA